EWYGIDPHDDSDNLVITQNKVYENGRHGIICSKRCDNVQITNNDSSNNGGSGIMIHRYVTDSVVSGNIANNNNDSGIAIFDSHSNLIFGNIARNNTKGIRLSVGSSDNIIKSNNFSYNSAYGIFTYKGTDLPTFGDGRIKSNTFANNTVGWNGYYGLKIKEADNNHFEGNNIIANNAGICLIDSRNNYFVNNLLQRNTQDYCE
ncbi:MAG: right-handed parallel beta-helix repeat-containing protein, partial [Nanoarchaeota archaeon]|nr:right-handed parallel beta-helix repeat-containing protein [Nanoarchaeota archaeon]